MYTHCTVNHVDNLIVIIVKAALHMSGDAIRGVFSLLEQSNTTNILGNGIIATVISMVAKRGLKKQIRVCNIYVTMYVYVEVIFHSKIYTANDLKIYTLSPNT